MRLVAITAVAAAACVLPAAASAQWAAQFVGQSEFLTLESGQIAESWFEARNVGSATWHRSFAMLGTQEPQDRWSRFYVSDDWINQARATAIDQESVAPGQVARFTFKVQAPGVEQTQTFYEHFDPVAQGIAWMDWGNVFLGYTVRPPIDPNVRILTAPSTVRRGDPIDVEAEASDNHGISHVVFEVAGQEVRSETSPYRARLSSSALGPGVHSITARAFDLAGHYDSDTRSITIEPGAAGGETAPGGTVTINEGLPFTNSPLVRLTVNPPADATAVRISNDGGFANAQTSPISGRQTYAWTLESTGPERLPKTVWVKFVDAGGNESPEHTDNIILDETPPRLRTATGTVDGCTGRFEMRLAASDATSGVTHVQLLEKGRRGHVIRAYRKRIRGRLAAKRVRRTGAVVTVSVLDGARNPSKSRTVRLRATYPRGRRGHRRPVVAAPRVC